MSSSGFKRSRSASYGPSQLSQRSSYTARSRKGMRLTRGLLSRARAGTSQPIFTETVYLGALPVNAGGIFQPSISLIPEQGQYSTLYRKYRMLSFEVVLCPNNNVNFSDVGTRVTVPRIAYSIDPSAHDNLPLNEMDVLNNDGSKIYQLSRPMRIKCRSPKPQLRMQVAGGAAAGAPATVDLQGNWLAWDDTNGVVWNGISYWISNASGADDTQYYVKITFQCADPR